MNKFILTKCGQWTFVLAFDYANSTNFFSKSLIICDEYRICFNSSLFFCVWIIRIEWWSTLILWVGWMLYGWIVWFFFFFVIESEESWFTKLSDPASLFSSTFHTTINYGVLVFVEHRVVVSIKRVFFIHFMFRRFECALFSIKCAMIITTIASQTDGGLMFIDQLNDETRASTIRLTTIKVIFVYNQIIMNWLCPYLVRGFSFMHIHSYERSEHTIEPWNTFY